MSHHQLTISATEHQQEELIALLSDFDPEGFEQKENELIAYFGENDPENEELKHLLQGYEHSWTEVEEKNWNEEWEKNFQPVIAGNFCAVRAHFHQPIPNVEHEIIITPKMSFGTGHHATTFMMMEQMKNIDFKGRTVLDFGTGTGILAILAEKLGAAAITAIDNDPWSIENAAENCRKNNCEKVSISLADNIPSGRFDVVLANINRNIILEHIDQIKSALDLNGKVLISGILSSDEPAVIDAFNNIGLHCAVRMLRDNWLSLLLVNNAG